MSLRFVDEYRDPTLAKALVAKIHAISRKPLRLMEVCGTHTMSIFRHGIRHVLPNHITLLSGPGCPVCVTDQKEMDAFVALARMDNVMVTTFGDLMKVPGSGSTLAREKASGADVRMVYSIFDAVTAAQANPDKQVVFCAVGFETTIPTIAAGILMARERGLDNFSVYSANKLTPPALSALMQTPGVAIDGFILPGHVSVITGMAAFQPVCEAHGIPAVIAGFEPVDILKAVYQLVQQNEAGTPALENAYPRAVSNQGNLRAQSVMHQVFSVCDADWRGIGTIANSGMSVAEPFAAFDAAGRFTLDLPESHDPPGCACGEVLMGLKTPDNCPLYKKRCTPMTPVGPCMVSSEGACAAFYRYA